MDSNGHIMNKQRLFTYINHIYIYIIIYYVYTCNWETGVSYVQVNKTAAAPVTAQITWDLRAIRAQRDRAEEAAARARAVYDAERVKLHTHVARPRRGRDLGEMGFFLRVCIDFIWIDDRWEIYEDLPCN